jgi:hypothetical protein
VAAAHSTLQDIASGLAGRPENIALISHNFHPFLEAQNFMKAILSDLLPPGLYKFIQETDFCEILYSPVIKN